MSITLRKHQLIALAVLAFLTLVALALTIYSASAHLDLWHTISAVGRNGIYWGP